MTTLEEGHQRFEKLVTVPPTVFWNPLGYYQQVTEGVAMRSRADIADVERINREFTAFMLGILSERTGAQIVQHLIDDPIRGNNDDFNLPHTY